MAHLYLSGFELNSLLEDVSGGEWTVITGATISSTVSRSGAYSGRISSLTSGVEQGFLFKFLSSTAAGPYYLRTYLRVASRPSASNHIISLNSASGSIGSTDRSKITLEADGSLALRLSTGVQVGSNSAILALDTWYCIELKHDASQASGADVLEARLDGVVFATSSVETLSNVFAFSIGGNLDDEAQTTGEWFFDDIALSSSAYPGPGKVIHLKPNAAGDNSAWTPTSGANYTNIDEVTPDDATSIVSSATLGQIDDYNLEASGITGTVNAVMVGVVFSASASTGGSGFKTRIKASSGGTVEESAEIVPASTSWRFNNVSIPRNYALTLDDLPGTSTTPWTTADLDNAQIGVHLTTAGTNTVRITTMWLVVDYTESGGAVSPTSIKVAGTFATVTPKIKVGGTFQDVTPKRWNGSAWV